GVPVAVVEGAEERGHDYARRAEDAVGDRLLTGAGPSLEAKVEQEVLDGARREADAPFRPVPLLDRGDTEQLFRQTDEVVGLALIGGGQADGAFHGADVAVTDQVPQERGEVFIDDLGDADWVGKSVDPAETLKPRVVFAHGAG